MRPDFMKPFPGTLTLVIRHSFGAYTENDKRRVNRSQVQNGIKNFHGAGFLLLQSL
jgi:hypothetical protein